MHSNVARKTIFPVLTALLVVACGGSSDSDGSASGRGPLSQATATSLEGVYETTTLTENDSGCEGEGTDLLASTGEPYFGLVATEIFGQQLLQLFSCADVPDCQDKAASIAAMQPVMYQYSASLSEEVSADELAGFTAWTGSEEDGMCVEREYEEFTLTRTGDTVRVERITKGLADKPPEDGFCVAEPASDRQEAAGAPCVSSAVIEGQRVADL